LECTDEEEIATTEEEAEKFLEAGPDDEEQKKMETDTAEDAENLVCDTAVIAGPDAFELILLRLRLY